MANLVDFFILGVFFVQNSLNFFMCNSYIHPLLSSAHPAIFVILKFVDPTRAMEYILYFACVPRVAMKYKIYLMAHALRVGLSEIQ